MKLRKLHIDNYKMFKDFDISFVDDNDEALPIVVLAGVNGSGKTSLLEYVQRCNHHPSNIDLDSIDGIQDTDYIEVNKNNKIEKYSPYSPPKPIPDSEAECIEVPDVEYIKVLDAEDKDIVYLPSGKDKIENIKEAILEHYRRLSRQYSHIETLKVIQKFLDDTFSEDMNINFIIDDIDIVLRDDEKVILKNRSGDTFDIDELSTGEKTLLSKVLYLYFKDYKDKVILIDEPELSLHPTWQNKVLKIYENFAKQNNCQIIIATHSPHIINSAKNEYLRILRKNEEGNIEVINDLKAHGRDINSILFDVMGEVAYRPKEFDDKIDRLHIAIDSRKIEEALKRLEELKKDYGENDEVVMEAQMLIDMFSRDEV